MSWRRRWSADLSMAAAALGVALTAVSWSLIRLVTFDPLPAALAATAVTDAPVPQTRSPSPHELEQAAVEADPFNPARRRPAVAFRLPGEGIPEPQTPATTEAGSLALIGTAVLPEGRSFAMCRVGTEAPRVVRVGEQVGGFTLKTVSQGRAVFLTAQGTTLEVGVPKAGS
jgi:hypothetical protein